MRILAMVLALAGFAEAAQAEYLSTTCSRSRLTPSGTTDCNSKVRYKISVQNSTDRIALELTTPSAHCSRVKYIVAGVDVSFLGQTGLLAAGESERLNVGDGIAPGIRSFDIWAEGEVAGCNVGAMQSWGVEARPVLLP